MVLHSEVTDLHSEVNVRSSPKVRTKQNSSLLLSFLLLLLLSLQLLLLHIIDIIFIFLIVTGGCVRTRPKYGRCIMEQWHSH